MTRRMTTRHKRILATLLILGAFFTAFILGGKSVEAQGGDCPEGSIGNCTELEYLGIRCSGMCTYWDPTYGWVSIRCKQTDYYCYAPLQRRYTVGECVYSCTPSV